MNNKKQSESDMKIFTNLTLLFGDSMTAGSGVGKDHRFSNILKTQLNGLGEQQYEIVNLAVPGYGAVQISKLMQDVSLKFEPDLMIYVFYQNDFEKQEVVMNRGNLERIEAYSEHVTLISDNPIMIKLVDNSYFFRFINTRVVSILLKFDESYSPVIYHLSDEEGLNAINEMIAFSYSKNIPFLIVNLPTLSDDVFTSYDLQSRLILNKNVKLYNLAPDLRELPGSPDLCIDTSDDHPNEIAHTIIADYIFKKIVNLGIV